MTTKALIADIQRLLESKLSVFSAAKVAGHINLQIHVDPSGSAKKVIISSEESHLVS